MTLCIEDLLLKVMRILKDSYLRSKVYSILKKNQNNTGSLKLLPLG